MSNKEQVLYEIKIELKRVIKRLELVSAGVHQNFLGIGENNCANAIDNKILQYRRALNKLELVNCDNCSKTGE